MASTDERENFTGIFGIIRASINDDGIQGNDNSSNSDISADGRFVAFESDASNLVEGDTNGITDIFVRDLLTGTITRVSVADDGTQGNNSTRSRFNYSIIANPTISADGRFVAFQSTSSNLVTEDTNDFSDVFVRDLHTGTTTRVSIANDGTQGNYSSSNPSISADGRFVAFDSYARNLVAGVTRSFVAPTADIFVRDLQMGTTTRVSIANNGTLGNSDSTTPAISADGRFVAFVSNASNLVAGDTNNSRDIFVRDLQIGTTTRVSVADDGTQGNSDSTRPAISADGRFVAFWSLASNLVALDTNNSSDIFVRDLQTGTITRVSVADDGTEGNNNSSFFAVDISADGRFVAFQSSASNLVALDTNNSDDIFIRNLKTGTITRVSVALDGTQGNDFSYSFSAAISADGRFVAFDSSASNLVARDTNNRSDIFVRETNNIPNNFSGEVASIDYTATRVSIANDGTQGNNGSFNPTISADGSFVAFSSDANNLVAGDTNNWSDVFVRNLQTGTITRVSVANNRTQGNNSSFNPAISASGRFVAFSSNASNLLTRDINNTTDIFVRDLQTDTTSRVSVANDGTEGNSTSSNPTISGDGSFVAFSSGASNLVALDTNNNDDIFVRNLQTNTTSRVSVADDGTEGNSTSSNPAISANGRFVAFDSFASNLVAGDTNNTTDIFVRDLQTDTTTRVSVADDGTQGNSSSFNPAISADGRFVAFQSSASNLVAGDTKNTEDIFVRDLLTNTTTRVFVADDGTERNNSLDRSNATFFNPAISADGRFVAFLSFANNLVAGDTNNSRDIFVRDRLTGTTTLISFADARTLGNNESFNPAISADGRFIAFDSLADNLVARDTNNRSDVFVRETNPPNGFDSVATSIEYTATLVSVADNGTQGNNSSINPAISAEGRFVAFSSDANNLVALDSNNSSDIFVRDRLTGTTTRVSVADDGTEATDSFLSPSNPLSSNPAISGDGRFVAFQSRANNLVLGDTNNREDIFVRDLNKGTITRVSVADDITEGNGSSSNAVISASGRFVAFDSRASNLVGGDTNNNDDIFVRDLQTGTTRVSVANDGSEATDLLVNSQLSSRPAISGDGRFVAFSSRAVNLVAGDTNNTTDVFVRDRLTDTTTRVSVADDGSQGNNSSFNSAISGDGRFVAFESTASNLVAGDTNFTYDIFVRDRLTGTTIRVSVADDGTEGNSISSNPAISASGRFVAFSSSASNLVAGDTNNREDIFVRDLHTGTITLISANDTTKGNNTSSNPTISADGRFVVFDSFASNLVARDTNDRADIFIREINNDKNGDRTNIDLVTVALGSNINGTHNDDDHPSLMGGYTLETLTGIDPTTVQVI